MVTIKSHTSLEQSKKLAEILPIESADMDYIPIVNLEGEYSPSVNVWDNKHEEDWIPCWSLSALLGVIPQELFHGEYIINITEGVNYKWVISYEPPYDISSYVNVSGDSLLDCCVEMIIKLKERNLL